MSRKTSDEWKNLAEQQASSGLSVPKFCEQLSGDIDENTIEATLPWNVKLSYVLFGERLLLNDVLHLIVIFLLSYYLKFWTSIRLEVDISRNPRHISVYN